MNVIHTNDGNLDEFSVCCNGVSTAVLVDDHAKSFNMLYMPSRDKVTGFLLLNTIKDAESMCDALTKAIEHVKAGK